MAERTEFDEKLMNIGNYLYERRKMLGPQYKSRDKFIDQRSIELFGGDPWISSRHLASLERGKNWISIELLIKHAFALECDPVNLFSDIVSIYYGREPEYK